MQGRVALVTGSTTGMGRAIIESLARSGCNVVLHGLTSAEKLQEQAQGLRENNVDVLTSTTDLRSPEGIYRLVEEASSKLGPVDILVNNAGMQHVAPVHEFPNDKWNDLISVMLSAPFHTTKAVLPSMIDKGWGRIINISSFHGKVASPFKAPYCAAKHGVAGLTKSVALEVATKGITCNAICPGYVWTELIEKQLASSAKSRGITEEQLINDVLLRPQPIGRFVSVDEIASLAMYLCRDEAAAITGALLSADGGWTTQ
eukprot:jgi/Ulvmu1/6842/UM031_0047.1